MNYFILYIHQNMVNLTLHHKEVIVKKLLNNVNKKYKVLLIQESKKYIQILVAWMEWPMQYCI